MSRNALVGITEDDLMNLIEHYGGVHNIVYGDTKLTRVKDDISKIDFDCENSDYIEECTIYGAGGLSNIDTINGIPIAWCFGGGDWEDAVIFCMYVDSNGDLRGYVPDKGNTYYKKGKCAYNCDILEELGVECDSDAHEDLIEADHRLLEECVKKRLSPVENPKAIQKVKKIIDSPKVDDGKYHYDDDADDEGTPCEKTTKDVHTPADPSTLKFVFNLSDGDGGERAGAAKSKEDVVKAFEAFIDSYCLGISDMYKFECSVYKPM